MKTGLRHSSGGGPQAQWTAHWTSGDDITMVLGFLISDDIRHTEAFTIWTNNKTNSISSPTLPARRGRLPVSASQPHQLPHAPLAPATLDSVPLPLVSPLESQYTVVLNDTTLFCISFNLVQNGHTAYFPVRFFSPQRYEMCLLILSRHMVGLGPHHLLHEYTTHPPLRANGEMGFFRLQAITKCCCFTSYSSPGDLGAVSPAKCFLMWHVREWMTSTWHTGGKLEGLGVCSGSPDSGHLDRGGSSQTEGTRAPRAGWARQQH